MKRLILPGLLLFAAACAHAPQASPARVIVNASDGATGRVDTAALQRITEAEMREDGVVGQPLTLTVFLDSYGYVEQPEPSAFLSTDRGLPDPVSARAFPNLSATPWEDGLIVEHGDHVTVHSPNNTKSRREVVVGTYTISDDAGNVREQRPVVVGALSSQASMMYLQLESMKTTGHYLAGRVAALSK